MATIKTHQPYHPDDHPDWYPEGRPAIMTRPMYFDLEGELTYEPYTFNIRGNSGRRGASSIDNLFIDRLRATAVIWRDVLTPAQRALWKAAEEGSTAARPGMEEPRAGGWGLFAEVALMLVAWDQSTAAASTESYGPDLISLEFLSAVAATGVMTFRAGFQYGCYGPILTYAFVHQNEPRHINKRDWSRRAFGCGYKRFEVTSTVYQTFTAPQAYPFNAGDQVGCLVRIHQSLRGVTNHKLTVTAT